MYSTMQQIVIINNCNTATELVTARQLLEETNNFNNTAFLVFNLKLQQLFFTDKI